MDTVAGAAIQDYPKHRYRVFILDDANDSDLKRQIDDFNANEWTKRLGIQPVVYLNRSKGPGVLHHYKAGNLDSGIRTSKDQYGSSELIAGLDADMIPEPDWLARTVPHLVLSPGLALVSPPQYSYTIPEGDILAQDANVLQQVLEPVRDRIGCSMCHGSGYVMRREALDAIGGWPLVNIGEDILCSYQLNRAGWQTAFIEDKLQFGTAPESFHAYVAQRMRWTAGNLLSPQKFNFFLPYLDYSKQTGVQRFHGWMQGVKTYAWVALAVPLILLPVCLPLMGDGERHGDIPWNRDSVRYPYIFTWFAFRLWRRTVFAPHLGLTNVRNLSRNRYWITPYIAYGFYQSLWVNLEETKFEISGTFVSPIDERSEKARPGLWKRMTNSLVLMHTVYWLIASIAFLAWVSSIGVKIGSGSQSHAYLHTGLTMRLFEIVMAALVPVRYMAFPPSAVNRRERLARDERGAYRLITKTWTKRGDNGVSLREVIELLLIVVCDWL
ncbi:hypothetical protein LTR85_012223 [Meristemomyces frigidus]|nr:hypothetical protein LTR85_012223 [Meristemomyces frigidus]